MFDLQKALKELRGLKRFQMTYENSAAAVGEAQTRQSAASINDRRGSHDPDIAGGYRAPLQNHLPPGHIESTPLGSHYVARMAYSHDYFHGRVRLSRLSSADLQCLMTFMREKSNAPERQRIVFLDTETTGIQGGTGICPFLVGVGYFEADEFHVVQFFIRDFD